MGSFLFNDYVINKSNLISNIKTIKLRLKPNVKFCAVVKADAYGVGASDIIPILEDSVDAFAVANLKEGIEARTLQKTKKIIVLGAINLDEIKTYEENVLAPTISTVLEARKLSSEVKNPILVEFGLNTGMSRIGFSKKEEIFEAISCLMKNDKISISGAYSHLATKQNNIEFMREQREKFDTLLEAFDGMNIVRHISNSSASWFDNNYNYDMVRVGFGMYGMNDDFEGLKRVVEIYSRVVKLNFLKAGDSVGYDCSFVAKRDSVIAVLPIGYYDGVCRRLSNKGRVIINGKFAPIIGRVCMDMMMVDVTDIENVDVGIKVIIIGSCGENEITMKEHADIVETSEYEILSRFNYSRMNKIIKD